MTNEVNLGSLQRIAAACEAMAKNWNELTRERDYLKRRRDELEAELRRERRRAAALKGVVKRLKARA